MSGSPAHEIGIVHYPGAPVACILGLTDFLGIASTIALDQRRSGQTALRSDKAGERDAGRLSGWTWPPRRGLCQPA